MRRILFASCALMASTVVATPALAGPGSWDVGQQPVVYPAIGADGIYHEQLGDRSTPAGGVPPYYAIMPANISSPNTTDEIVASGDTTGDDEFKFRLSLRGDHALADDPLLLHCQRGKSHPHEFMGPVAAGACSTYFQLRTDGIARKIAGLLAGTNPGETINLSSYWHMGIFDRNPLGDGVDRMKKSLVIPLYYQPPTNTLTGEHSSSTYVPIPAELGVIFGQNMGDPWNLQHKAWVAASNAANAAAGGPSAAYSFQSNGFVMWECTNSDMSVVTTGPSTNIEDLTCPAKGILILEMHGPGCWDGKNGNSPDGRSHVLPMIRVEATNGTFDDVCPVDWFKIPILVDKPEWVLNKAISGSVPNDSPYASSDAMFQAKARADANRCITATARGSSATVCAPAGAATYVAKAGASPHADLLSAWDLKFLWRGMNKCDGIPIDPRITFSWIDADRTPHGTACNSDTLSTMPGTISRLATSPRLPAVPGGNSAYDGDTINEYYPMPAPMGHMGPMTITH